MRRLLVLVLALVACKKQEASSSGGSATPPAPPSAGSAASVPADAHASDAAPAAAARVDLLRAVPTIVTVSSTVANKAILPNHLVDKDLTTAWNSKTGELAGVWVSVAVPAGAVIEELRLTVGHTGKGPKQEDYFVMNPRVEKIVVEPKGGKATEVALDVERRDLQVVPVHAEGEVRLRVVAFRPGSKKTWREIAISELEVWGTPPPAWAPPTDPVVPTVRVEPPPAPTSKLFDKLCADLEERKRDREKRREEDAARCAELPEDERDHCGVDAPGDPDCSVNPVGATLAPPWRAIAEHCEVDDDIYGPARCALLIDVGGKAITAAKIETDHKAIDLTVDDATLENVTADADRELVVHYTIQDQDDETTYVIVCDASDGCTTPLETGTKSWSADVSFADGTAVLVRASGSPPDGALGKHPLKWR